MTDDSNRTGAATGPGEVHPDEGTAARSAPTTGFVETSAEEQIAPEILTRRICDFDLKIEGRPLGRWPATRGKRQARCGLS
jgi:hypothetical protein